MSQCCEFNGMCQETKIHPICYIPSAMFYIQGTPTINESPTPCALPEAKFILTDRGTRVKSLFLLKPKLLVARAQPNPGPSPKTLQPIDQTRSTRLTKHCATWYSTTSSNKSHSVYIYIYVCIWNKPKQYAACFSRKKYKHETISQTNPPPSKRKKTNKLYNYITNHQSQKKNPPKHPNQTTPPPTIRHPPVARGHTYPPTRWDWRPRWKEGFFFLNKQARGKKIQKRFLGLCGLFCFLVLFFSFCWMLPAFRCLFFEDRRKKRWRLCFGTVAGDKNFFVQENKRYIHEYMKKSRNQQIHQYYTSSCSGSSPPSKSFSWSSKYQSIYLNQNVGHQH